MSKQDVRAGTPRRGRAGAGLPTPRRRLSAAARRELIERAATEVFAVRGYAGASIDEIARRSDVTPPVVYDHFASKLDLFTRLLERTRDELLAMWVEQLSGDVDRRSPLAVTGGRNAGSPLAVTGGRNAGSPLAVTGGRNAAPDVRMHRAFDAWARYVEEHRFAARMYFQEATGDAEARAAHRAIQAQGRAALGAILGAEPGAERIAGSTEPEALEMAAEVMRAGFAGLAIWWDEHPHVPREQIVATAMNVLWVGFEQLQGEHERALRARRRGW
ncbi:MAG TPA: helix-turn-helix domain-containing protein [Conexibacter sp.]|nr:helix-turn-helix domain-containing protein [Conexibacter sp.]